jgi:hypothetical protein
VAHTGKLPSELAVGTERDPDNVAPIVAFLASDAAQHVNGHIFGSFGYNVVLMSQPKIVKQLRFDHRPSLDDLGAALPRAFGPEFEGEANPMGFSSMVREIPEGEWHEVRPGLRFWGTRLEPYGELAW